MYDANGNLVYGDGKYREYNSLNQLVRIRSSDNSTILEEYVHHPMEERIYIKKVYNSSNQVAETVIYFSKTFVRVKNVTGTYDFTYVRDDAGNLVGQVNADGTKFYVHGDAEGSTSVITNQSGQVIENTTYSPFGEILGGGTVSRFDSEGKEFSSVTGDYDFHFRKFLMNIHIFGQPDTLIPNIYDPQSLNRYMFERGNPDKNVDKDGHSVLAVLLLTASVDTLLIKLEVYKLKKQTEGVTTEETSLLLFDAGKTVLTSYMTPVKGAEYTAKFLDFADTAGGLVDVKKDLQYIAETCATHPDLCPKNRDMITTEQFNQDILGGSDYFITDTDSQADESKDLSSEGSGGGWKPGDLPVRVDKDDKRSALQRFWDRVKNLFSGQAPSSTSQSTSESKSKNNKN